MAGSRGSRFRRGSAGSAIGSALPLSGGTLTGDLSVPDEVYDATAWNGSVEVPTKNAVRDKIEAVVGASITPAIVDAAGDLIVGTAADTVARLAIGSALFALRANAAGTALEYVLLGSPSNPSVAYTHDPAAVIGFVETTANWAHAFRFKNTMSASKLATCVGIQNGNVCVGVYEGTAGQTDPAARVATSGSVACPAAGYAEISLGATVTLSPLRFGAIAMDGAVATFSRISPGGSNQVLRKGFSARKVTAFPLPDPFGTPDAYDSQGYVLVGVA